jgi:hypothetical protein
VLFQLQSLERERLANRRAFRVAPPGPSRWPSERDREDPRPTSPRNGGCAPIGTPLERVPMGNPCWRSPVRLELGLGQVPGALRGREGVGVGGSTYTGSGRQKKQRNPELAWWREHARCILQSPSEPWSGHGANSSSPRTVCGSPPGYRGAEARGGAARRLFCGRRSRATLAGRCYRLATHARRDQASVWGGALPRTRGPAPDQGAAGAGGSATTVGRWWPAGRLSSGRARPSPRAREGPRVEEWEEPGSSSRATGSPVLGSGTSGSPSEPTPMGCPPRPPLPRRPRRPHLLPGSTEGLR